MTPTFVLQYYKNMFHIYRDPCNSPRWVLDSRSSVETN